MKTDTVKKAKRTAAKTIECPESNEAKRRLTFRDTAAYVSGWAKKKNKKWAAVTFPLWSLELEESRIFL